MLILILALKVMHCEYNQCHVSPQVFNIASMCTGITVMGIHYSHFKGS